MTMNDIKKVWKYQNELQLINTKIIFDSNKDYLTIFDSDFIPTKQSELRKTELITLINELLKR
ncbi:MAG TPA: hypothetical protein EYQ51_07640 [Alphaproteobacteria bacterium]|nr:hypothetical protein [Alphaproteobacteria bacterium]